MLCSRCWNLNKEKTNQNQISWETQYIEEETFLEFCHILTFEASSWFSSHCELPNKPTAGGEPHHVHGKIIRTSQIYHGSRLLGKSQTKRNKTHHTEVNLWWHVTTQIKGNTDRPDKAWPAEPFRKFPYQLFWHRCHETCQLQSGYRFSPLSLIWRLNWRCWLVTLLSALKVIPTYSKLVAEFPENKEWRS